MFPFTIDEIISITQGVAISRGINHVPSKIIISDKKITENCLFACIKGENFNANKIVLEVLHKGASICLIDEVLIDTTSIPPNKTVVLVQNVVDALGKLAKAHRGNITTKIIGITGSVGKTTTKDIIASALSNKYKVFKTKGNYNSKIGLPLMVLQLDNSYDIAVLELGMSELGQIKNLADISRPDIAVITNIGLSHIESLKNQKNIYKAKKEITTFFSKENTLIINSDDTFLNKLTHETHEFELITAGLQSKCDFFGKILNLTPCFSSFLLKDLDGENMIKDLQLTGAHNILNCLLAVAVAKKLGLTLPDILSGLSNIDISGLRLDVIEENEITILNDCYNASPDSMKAAIDTLCLPDNEGRKICILGTMKELGEYAESSHFDIANYLKKKDIDLILSVGEFSYTYKNVLPSKVLLFENKETLIHYAKKIIQPNDFILIKASRSMKFESICPTILKYKNHL